MTPVPVPSRCSPVKKGAEPGKQHEIAEHTQPEGNRQPSPGPRVVSDSAHAVILQKSVFAIAILGGRPRGDNFAKAVGPWRASVTSNAEPSARRTLLPLDAVGNSLHPPDAYNSGKEPGHLQAEVGVIGGPRRILQNDMPQQ